MKHLTLALLVSFVLAVPALAEEMSAEQMTAAQSLLAEIADETVPPDVDSLSEEQKVAHKLLQEADVALLEASAWLKRELPAEAGVAFIRSGEALAAIPEEWCASLQPRLGDVEHRRLDLARQFLANHYLIPSKALGQEPSFEVAAPSEQAPAETVHDIAQLQPQAGEVESTLPRKKLPPNSD
jgi:hypothetical protein